MRTVIYLVVLSILGCASGASAQPKSKGGADLRGTEAQPAVVRVLAAPDAKAAIERQQEAEAHKRFVDGVLAGATALLAFVTAVLAYYTFKLWRAAMEGAEAQAIATRESLRVSRDAADAARRNADAAILDKGPFLHPRVADFNLHPPLEDVGVGAAIPSSIRLRFDNMGKTPAMVRRLGVKLLLQQRGEVPANPLPLDSIPSVESSATIGPDSSGAARAWSFERPIDENEAALLAASTKRPNYLRFYAEGFTVYDDIFNVRHTKRFLIKIRQNGFQAVRGGEAFNKLLREPLANVVAEQEE
jgi:hypothetical protein